MCWEKITSSPQNYKWLPFEIFVFTKEVSRKIKPVKNMKRLGTKMIPKKCKKKQLKRNLTSDPTNYRVLEMNQVESRDLQLKSRKFLSYFRTSFENNWTSKATGKSYVKKHRLIFRQKTNWMRNISWYSAKFSVLRKSNVQSTELQKTSIKNFRFYWTSYQET